jgi:hypothetical protein
MNIFSICIQFGVGTLAQGISISELAVHHKLAALERYVVLENGGISIDT